MKGIRGKSVLLQAERHIHRADFLHRVSSVAVEDKPQVQTKGWIADQERAQICSAFVLGV
jgi:hypothetical protein